MGFFIDKTVERDNRKAPSGERGWDRQRTGLGLGLGTVALYVDVLTTRLLVPS